MAILCFFCVLLRILAVTEQFRPEGIKKRRMDGQTGSSDAPPAGTKNGLMPAPPRNRAEREAYEELYPYQAAAQPKD